MNRAVIGTRFADAFGHQLAGTGHPSRAEARERRECFATTRPEEPAHSYGSRTTLLLPNKYVNPAIAVIGISWRMYSSTNRSTRRILDSGTYTTSNGWSVIS